MGIGYSKSDLQVPTAHNAHNRNHQICQKNMIQNEEKKALFNLPEKAISPAASITKTEAQILVTSSL